MCNKTIIYMYITIFCCTIHVHCTRTYMHVHVYTCTYTYNQLTAHVPSTYTDDDVTMGEASHHQSEQPPLPCKVDTVIMGQKVL